jgi:SPP1 family phage portal protein
VIVRSREHLDKDGSVPMLLLVNCIAEHMHENDRLIELERYYDGEHKIKNRTFSSPELPNNRIVCNHAEYIAEMAVGYVHGAPVMYSGGGSELLNDIFTRIDEDSHNAELALDISIYGHGNELIYMSDDPVPIPLLAVLSPKWSFVVYDDTVAHDPLFAISIRPAMTIYNTQDGFYINLYTDTMEILYKVKSLEDSTPETISEREHYFGGIPIIEYHNNKKCKGDFEGVITLIDAYNLLQSDRVNDKEQLIDALLAISGATLGDNEDEMINTAKLLKEMKIIELPSDGDAKWLVKSLNETEIEVLKQALKDDIHEFSKVPCLTDENFAANASGVAMKYKLLGFEQLAKTKERYFKQGLRRRIELISNVLSVQAKRIDPVNIDIIMKRSLPVDDEMFARIAQETDGFLSWETRLSRFDAEIDIEEERKRLSKDQKENMLLQQSIFGSPVNTPPGGDGSEE